METNKKQETYTVDVRCINCNWTGKLEYTKGVPANPRRNKCVMCECTEVLVKT